MSTKDLSRTVIEGGRSHGNCHDRRDSHRGERRGVHQALDQIRDDHDADEILLAPRRQVSSSFYDKLAPAERWLRKQAGRPWDKVRGELFARFDTRTTAGRHIVFDHLLASVQVEALAPRWSRLIMFVGRGGILRVVERAPRSPRMWPWTRPAWLDWLAGRRIATRGPVRFWLEPTPHERFRQSRRLDEDELAFWDALPAWFRVDHESVL
jgi:hypothetical protein